MRLVLTFLAVVVSLSAAAQTTISGTVTNLRHEPVGDVIVRVADEKRTLAFSTTNAKGAYRLTVKDVPKGEAFIRFSHISYEVEEEAVSLDGKPQVKDVLLVPKTITLKEVKVRATPLTQMGDTLNHNLASFLGKGDVSLEDGLKRLPGVEVSKSGAISYMGKPISAFNIEGLNLLGGKYNLATRNIPADYVTQVQVIHNYHERNAMGTVNAIEQLDSARTMKVNADYTYHRATHNISTATTYLTDGGDLTTVDERTSPLGIQHLPTLSLNYRENAATRFVNETLTLKAKFEQNEGDIYINNVWAEQRRKATSVEANNAFLLSRRRGGHTFHLSSDLTFQRTPALCLSFANGGKAWSQTVQSTSLTTHHRTSFDLHLTRKFTLNLPVSLAANYDFVETVLSAATVSQQSRQQGGGHNRLRGTTVVPSLSPGFEWRNASRRLYASVAIPLSLRVFCYGDTHLTKCYASPSLRLNYTFSANSRLAASSALHDGTGDMLDLLTAPMQTTYRTTRTASGVIGESRNWTSSLDWRLQVPLHYFTLSLGVSHDEGKRNTLTSQSVSGIDVSTSSLFRDTRSRSTSLSLSSSKNIPSLFAKFGIKANYSFGDGEQAVDGNVIQNHHRGSSLSGHVGITPVSWLEMDVDISHDWQRSSYEATRNTLTSLTHSGSLHLFPVASLDVSVNYDHVRRQITADRYQHMSLFNAAAQYKFRHLVLRLELDNLLNQRHYAYTVFDGINTYTYDYGLCGRTVFVKATFKLLKK